MRSWRPPFSGLDLYPPMVAPWLLGCPGTHRHNPLRRERHGMKPTGQNGRPWHVPALLDSSSKRKIELSSGLLIRCYGMPGHELVSGTTGRDRRTDLECAQRGGFRTEPRIPARHQLSAHGGLPAAHAVPTRTAQPGPEPAIGLDLYSNWSRPISHRYQHGFSTRFGNDGK